MTDSDKSNLCRQCQKCCLLIAIPVNGRASLSFYATRGIDLRQRDGVTWALMPQTCQHVGVFGCRIYETRPQGCRDYDGTKDSFLDGQCEWNKT